MANTIKMMDRQVIEGRMIQVNKARFGLENRRMIRKGNGSSALVKSDMVKNHVQAQVVNLNQSIIRLLFRLVNCCRFRLSESLR